MKIQTPILFVTFNRFEKTKKVFSEIREYKPSKLYIASDGPRKNNKEDALKIRLIREYLLNNIDWECDFKTLFRDENIGLPKANCDAISWFFLTEEEGIVLEDDTLPSQSFFRFCTEMLDRYRSDNRVMNICGFNIISGQLPMKSSYFFSYIPHAWGWATWKRAWAKYDFNMSLWTEASNAEVSDTHQLKYFRNSFENVVSGKSNSCLLRWYFAIAVNNGLNIIPRKSLICNIGMDSEATNFNTKVPKYCDVERNEIPFPLIHPKIIYSNNVFDSYRINEFNLKEHRKGKFSYVVFKKYQNLFLKMKRMLERTINKFSNK